MTRYLRNWLIGATLYAILAETAVFVNLHHIHLDPWVQGNGVFLLCVGGVMLFVTGLYGLAEGAFWR